MIKLEDLKVGQVWKWEGGTLKIKAILDEGVHPIILMDIKTMCTSTWSLGDFNHSNAKLIFDPSAPARVYHKLEDGVGWKVWLIWKETGIRHTIDTFPTKADAFNYARGLASTLKVLAITRADATECYEGEGL